jgi:hypothetical protein
MPRKKKTSEEQEAEDYFVPEEKNVVVTEKKVKEVKISPENILKNSTEKKVVSFSPKEEVVKNAVSKKYNSISKKDLETIESSPRKRVYTRKSTKKKSSRAKIPKKTTTKKVNFVPPKLSLKKDGYELIITEKPQAAAKIATALGMRLSEWKIKFLI